MDLEKAAWEQSALIAVLTRCGLWVDAGVQADIENWDCSCTTYARVVKLTPPIQNVTKLASGQSVGAENISVEPSDSKYTGQKRKWNRNGKCDVKGHMSSTAQNINKNYVNGKKKEHGTEKKWRQLDLPLVAILEMLY